MKKVASVGERPLLLGQKNQLHTSIFIYIFLIGDESRTEFSVPDELHIPSGMLTVSSTIYIPFYVHH